MKYIIMTFFIIISCSSEPIPPISTTKYSSLSVQEGKILYDIWCQSCHGQQGKGDGLNAFTLSPPPSDLTLAITSSKTSAQLFDIISKGSLGMNSKGAMPGYQHTLKDYQIHYLVNYVKALR